MTRLQGLLPCLENPWPDESSSLPFLKKPFFLAFLPSLTHLPFFLGTLNFSWHDAFRTIRNQKIVIPLHSRHMEGVRVQIRGPDGGFQQRTAGEERGLRRWL